MWLGSWFQGLGTAIEKQWSPEVFVLILVVGIFNTILSSDLRPGFGFKASDFANNLGPDHISICITKVKFGIWSVFQNKKPVEILKHWNYMVKFPGSGNQSCSCIHNTLQFFRQFFRQTIEQTIAIFKTWCDISMDCCSFGWFISKKSTGVGELLRKDS